VGRKRKRERKKRKKGEEEVLQDKSLSRTAPRVSSTTKPNTIRACYPVHKARESNPIDSIEQ
jgi:hypothetical protein